MRLHTLGAALKNHNNQEASWTCSKRTKISAKVISRTSDITETPALTS